MFSILDPNLPDIEKNPTPRITLQITLSRMKLSLKTSLLINIHPEVLPGLDNPSGEKYITQVAEKDGLNKN